MMSALMSTHYSHTVTLSVYCTWPASTDTANCHYI